MRPEVERHIAAMHIVMRTGCTLPEANAQLAALRRRAARQAHEQWRESLGKTGGKTPLSDASEPRERTERWMMRD